MHAPLFGELVVILGLAAGILLLFRRIRLPGILGFIVTGVIAGPHGLGWVHEVESVEAMAEIGVILLLFVIGMEFSLKKLASLGRTVFVGGLLQAGLTTAAITYVLGVFGMRMESAVFIGFLVTLSSTAIVLRVLQEQGRMDAAHGRAATAVLIFQDIIVVPMMLVTPMLAGKSNDLSGDLMLLLGKMLLLLVAVFVSGRYIVPRVLKQAVKGKGHELFIITIVVICFAAAYATQALGLSLALGAFFAGLVISETDHAYHATGIILPFHELFMSFFFVSIGMLVDLGSFLSSPFLILALFLGMTVLKVLATMISIWVLRYPLRTAMMTGLSLFQLGEFGFILAMPGIEYGLLSKEHYQLFLSVAILSMGATPFMLEYSERIVRRFFLSFVPATAAKRLDRMVRVRKEQDRSHARALRDHLVIIGFGLNGQNVASSAINNGVNCTVIESDTDLAAKARKLGLHVLVGDGANTHLLERAHVERARVVVVAVSDPTVTRNIVVSVRSLSSAAHVIVRTRYVREMRALLDAGANDVIPEEFETSIQIFHRVLRRYLVPEDRIQELIGGVRRDHYGMLRGQGTNRLKTPATPLAPAGSMELVTISVTLGHNKVVGHSLGELQLRERCGIQLLAIRRNGRYIPSPAATERILTDDTLYLLGTPDDVARLEQQLR
jgi:CPA2 family monovalent cation:H+ antiporter-2